MRSDNRISGIDIIGDVSWGTHFCQFYRTKEDLMDILIPYFKAGLEDNEYCVWALSEPIDKEEAKKALKVAILDIDTYLENGQIEIIPYAYWHLEEDTLDSQTVLNHLIEKTSKALTSGYDGLRYSENYFVGHEKLLDSTIGKYPMMALCTYPIDKYSAVEILDIVASHQFALIIREGKWERIESSCQKNSKECKQTEKTLQESEYSYKAIFDNSLDGIFITIPDGTILAANPAACRMFGMTEEEIIQAGRNGTVDTSDPRLKYFLEKRARTGRFKGRLNYRRKDGTIFPGEISSTLFKDKNGMTKGIMIIRDITERKPVEEALCESEGGFRALVTASSEMVYRVSPDWSEMRYFYGRGFLANTESPNPTWLREYVLPGDQPRVTAIINEAIRTKSTYQTEHRVRLADGSVGWIFSRAVPLLDANGEIVEWFGAASDITKRKKADEVLANIETARKKEIHHRIKNNLQVISSLLDLQAEQFRNREEIRDYEVLEAFRESQDRVISMALIHEELYRGEELDKLNFSLYIEELANTLFQTYRLGNNDISLNMDPEENLFFDMDTAVPLGIIVNELVSNSLKHAFPDRKKGEIQIKLHREDSTKFEIEDYESTSTAFTLTISDNGVGIPENLNIEDLDSLGIQLIITLVDQLDGELELKRDNGTEFTIRLTVTEKDNLAQVDLK